MVALAQKYTHPSHWAPHVKMIPPQDCVQGPMQQPSEDEDDKDFYAALQKTLSKKKYNGRVSKSHPVLSTSMPSSTRTWVQKQDSKMDLDCPPDSFLAVEKPLLITAESLHTLLSPGTPSEWNMSRRHSTF